MSIRDRIKKTIVSLGLVKLFPIARHARRALYTAADICGYAAVYPFLRHAPPEPAAVKKILVIRTDGIGDMVLSTPALRAVRESFPGAEIHLLAAPGTRDIVAAGPDIDRIILDGQEHIGRDYDLAIALHPGFRQNFLAYRSGARYRVGYAGRGGAFFLSRAVKDDRAARVRHEVESALEIVGLAGCAASSKKLYISITEQGERYADDFLREHRLTRADRIIAIHPGSSQAHIRWRSAGFARVADELMANHRAAVVLVGSPEEGTLIESVTALMRRKPIVVNNASLTQLVSLINRCVLFIGNSTGPLHIAAALKVPAVAIYGSIHPLDSYQEWGPYGEGNIVVSKNLPCKHCHPTDCRTFDCMDQVLPEDVLRAAEQLLGAGRPAQKGRL